MTRVPVGRRKRRAARAAAAAAALILAAAGCGGGAQDDPNTVTIAYQDFGTFQAADDLFTKVKEEFEGQNPDVTVELRPIEAPAEDYQTQVNLMNQSAAEAPDIIYEDSFTINQDVDAGYLAPLDEYWEAWEDAGQYNEQADAAVTALDGKRYAAMLGTDTRGLWYNTELFDQAGVDTPWEPRTWDEVLETARTIRSELGEEVTPLNVYSGTPAGEQSSMQGFQMLLSGTDGALFDEEARKWVTGSAGFEDALAFVETVYSEDLALAPRDALNANVATLNNEERIPAGEIAISLDGSWVTQSWIESANKPWPEWQDVMEFAPMPTQNGQDPGATSMSGGWTLALGSQSANPDLAWEVMSHALNEENATKFAIEGGQIPVREDVASSPEFLEASPMAEQAAALVDVTHFRPAYSEYPRISLAVQEAMEAVMLGEATPAEAAETYAQEVEGIAGADNVTSGG
ncbi:multiple sugar transport system substrate-binding protein [Spinactinospora alkalitolerans]|uniref:Multiple sugar transport system substrate-binding protein n=1 Tax=Spinactinospora alkalitolerans TaxID=687207 RepID=A0A852TWY9_9ACTN|nr:extracellular solute-binding protein [Spinactinospora alkalitolerans]NYE49026.1 multiple sugar transport system substrate-binding protein [Spinactinospora alkalitolerans]